MKRSDKKKLFLCILTTTIFGFSQSLAANLYVSPTGSGDNCTEANPCSFQTALGIAKGNGEDDTIYVSGGTYNVNSTLTYTNDDGDGGHSLTIQAKDPDNKPILDGGGNVQIMKVVTDENSDGGDKGGNIIINGIVFRNGKSSYSEYSYYGGGLFVQTGSASTNILNSKFENNTATLHAGGIYIKSDNGNITFENVAFENNTVYRDGGGGYVKSNNGEITIKKSIFKLNNSKKGRGGGFYIESVNGTIIIQELRFENNSAEGGGGLYINSKTRGDIKISDSFFEGNFVNSTTSGFCGGLSISIKDGSVIVSNSDFNNNTSEHSVGGAGIYSYIGNATVTIINSKFRNNSSKNGYSGGAYVYADFIFIENSTFENNTAGDSTSYGGGVSTGGGEITIKNSIFRNNVALANSTGGGIYTYLAVSNIRILNSIFENNTAGTGGGVYIKSHNATIENSTFKDNSAVYTNDGGGGAYITASISAIVRNSIFENNIANTDFNPDIDEGGHGGGLSISGSKATLVNNSFYKNSAYDGGGAYFWLDNSTIGNIYNNILWQNEATNGKDIYVNTDTMEDGNDAVVKIYNNDFTSNDFSGTSQSSTLYVTGTENYTQENNISSDPLFRDPEKGDFHLEADSPCIDKGTNDAPELPSTDKDGNHRIRGKNVDMGAYESSGESSNESSSGNSIITNPSNGTNEDDGGCSIAVPSTPAAGLFNIFLMLSGLAGLGLGARRKK